jgi:CBS domain-containing protein
MGVANVRLPGSDEQRRIFVRAILNDLQALEHMIDNDWFETDVMRIGAEQEMCLVDRDTFKAAPVNLKVLEGLKGYAWADTELAKFNLETNMTPRVFSGSALSDMQAEVDEHLAIIEQLANKENASVLLTGILPTLRKFDLEESNLTPMPRYKALIKAINSHKLDPSYAIRLQGIDELSVTHESPLIEAANTSFQVHLQVTPKEFVKMYNISQVLTGPIMATAANSPLVFGRRLWHENRIALFQQALDTRRTKNHMREHSARVSFGKSWITQSILDIYREDLARFRLLLAADIDVDSLAQVRNKEVPKLLALQVDNSTVYRWNRPCYGISDSGKPHLRIENRVLPAGPTTLDEIANAALWLGSMVGMSDRIDDVRDHMSFEDASDNFSKAAQFGLDSKFNWFGDGKITAKDLLESEIIPMAREGLKTKGINTGDIDKYMGIIEERSKRLCTGARWQLKSFTKLRAHVTRDEALSNITCSMLQNQKLKLPVHEWPLPDQESLVTYSPSKLKVEEFMDTDFVTCEPDDLIDLISEMMDWRQLRYVPVEDTEGKLSGLITAPLLLRYHVRKNHLDESTKASIREIMLTDPITIGPSASIVEAMEIMRTRKIGGLPVVKDGELIGMITVLNLLQVTGRLIKQLENQPKP